MKNMLPILSLPAGLSLLALAACQPQAPDGSPAPPPADAPPATAAPSGNIDISQPITARGTEPFWSSEIDGKTIRLKRIDLPDLVFDTPGAAIAAGRVIWIGKSEAGQQVTVTLYVSECSDGMSDAKYPMTAELVLPNETLRGCAAKTAESPKGG